MTISPANRFFYRVLAVLGAIGGLVVLYISARGPADFPASNELVEVAGTVAWTEPDEYSVNFRLAGDPRTFSYARKSGEISAVESSLNRPAAQPVSVLVRPQPQGWSSRPFYQVYQFKDSQGTNRTLAQIRAAWSFDYNLGYLAALMAFVASAFLEYVVRRSQPNNSSKPTPLRGAA